MCSSFSQIISSIEVVISSSEIHEPSWHILPSSLIYPSSMQFPSRMHSRGWQQTPSSGFIELVRRQFNPTQQSVKLLFEAKVQFPLRVEQVGRVVVVEEVEVSVVEVVVEVEEVEVDVVVVVMGAVLVVVVNVVVVVTVFGTQHLEKQSSFPPPYSFSL